MSMTATVPALTRCPEWCTTPAHRVFDAPGIPSREALELALAEPHEGPVYGTVRTSDAEVVVFEGGDDGESGVSLFVGGNFALTLPTGEAVARLAAMGDALRGASEDLAVLLAGGVK